MKVGIKEKLPKIKIFLRTLGIAAKEVIDDMFVVESKPDKNDFDKSIKRLEKRLNRQNKAIKKVDAKMTKWEEKVAGGKICLAELRAFRENTENKLLQLKAMQSG